MSRPNPQPAPATPPALVIGEGVTLLGVLRGLGAAGIPTLVANDPAGVIRWSRWFRRLPGEPLRHREPGALAEDLARLPLEQAVLIPCSDSAAVAVASLPPELNGRFRASCSSAEVQAILADKLRFARVLERLRIPHPRTVEAGSRAVVEELPDEDVPRYFLKPLDSESFSRRYGMKACLLRDKEHALGKYDWLAKDGSEVVLQEYIQGPPTRHLFVDGFVDRHGRVRARFARRRERMYPPAVGNSSSMVSIPLEEVADASVGLDRLLSDLGFRGIFSAEFKRDPRDEVCKLLEVNARPWWYVGFAVACGVNAPAMAYLDALEEEVPEVRDYPAGRWCVYPRLDLKACLHERRGSRPDLGAVASVWARAHQPVFAWSDPGPLACEIVRTAGRALTYWIPGRSR